MSETELTNPNPTAVPEAETDTKKKKRKKHPILRGIFLFLILAAVIGYGGATYYYYQHFMHNTTILGIDVSEKDTSAVCKLLEQRLSNTSTILRFSNGSTETLNGSDMELSLDELSTRNQLKKILGKQRAYLWPKYFFNQEAYSVEILSETSKQDITDAVKHLKHNSEKYEKEAVDAKIVYSKDTNKFSIQKETLGTVIDDDTLVSLIEQSFLDDTKEITLKDGAGYVAPKIYSTDEKLNKQLDAANKYCCCSITYDTTDGDITLDGSEVINWLTYDKDKKEYTKNEKKFKKKVKAFVKENLVSRYNTIGDSKTFESAEGGTKTVSGGNFGCTLDSSAEQKGLLADIEDGKVEVRKPETSGYQTSSENGGLSDTFVEVNLSKQKLYYHYKGKVVLTSNVVSGLYSNSERRTPSGCYYVYFKQRNRTLTGSAHEYSSFVQYWMAFNVGIGFHDASWRSTFGGSIYRTNGSHGCINMPTANARLLYYGNGSYEGIKVGTPVAVYY